MSGVGLRVTVHNWKVYLTSFANLDKGLSNQHAFAWSLRSYHYKVMITLNPTSQNCNITLYCCCLQYCSLFRTDFLKSKFWRQSDESPKGLVLSIEDKCFFKWNWTFFFKFVKYFWHESCFISCAVCSKSTYTSSNKLLLSSNRSHLW